MTHEATCPHCSKTLVLGDAFCPSCGRSVSATPANSFERFCAASVDIPLWLALSALAFWLTSKWWLSLAVWIGLTELGYQLNGSIGKSLAGLSVPVRTRRQHYLRETIGKLASLVMFGIGYVMVLSKEHLALHDHIAKTRVLRIGKINRPRLAAITLALLIAMIFSGYYFMHSRTELRSVSLNQSQDSSPDPISSRIPAVLTIYTYNPRGKAIAQGSGFLITSNGLGVTNFHVLNDSYSANAKLGDGRLYNIVEIHAYNAHRDIAIFQLGRKTPDGVEEPRGLPSLTLAPNDVEVGDRITAIGSPEGLANTVSDGIVSAIRSDDGQRFLQISAPISPGSSGGPVFNLTGQVVAISTFQLVAGQNLNFAIPADQIAAVEATRTDVSLQQLYWQQHLATARKSEPEAPKDAQQTATSQDSTQSLTGTFVGTVHNLTADLNANFGIFVEEDQNTISGCMVVRKPLYGSGPVKGTVEDSTVQFDVSGPLWLHFDGQLKGQRMSGVYQVIPSSGPPQNGEFLLERADAKPLPQGFNPLKDCPTDSDMDH